MLTAVLTLCDHVSGYPSGDADQSLARMRPPISPPPASHAGLAQLSPIIEVTRLSKREVQFSRRVGLTAPFVQGNKSALGPEKRKLPAPRNHVLFLRTGHSRSNIIRIRFSGRLLSQSQLLP